jgi:hypothetical protein
LRPQYQGSTGNKYIYLGSKINSEVKSDAYINKRIQNSSEFYQIKNGILRSRNPETIIYNANLY